MMKYICLFRLLRFIRLLAAQESLLPPDFHTQAPRLVRALRRLLIIGAPRFTADMRANALSAHLEALGTAYIKLGQSLATRPDIIGQTLADDLQHLQDRLPPFAMSHVDAILTAELDLPKEQVFAEFSEPVAAASIAQVHQAQLADGTKLAVKLLRPGVEKELAQALAGFFFAARMTERFAPMARRLKPVEIVQTLADSVVLEMDLRLEAAALSEMAENIRNDDSIRVPAVIWQATGRRVLTLHWVEGVKLSDLEALKKEGHDLPALAVRLLQAFLTHALRDGFFHADMHQGNLLIEPDGTLVMIDLGIMGRLAPDTRRFFAEILHGFITRDYHKLADIHFEAGYVPAHKNRDDFAQALRAIGEPISGQDADNISMARLLAQLFEVTGQFDMETQPQLLLLQKTMVVVEGVARNLDPQLNIWQAAEPIVSQWLKDELGPEAVLQQAVSGAQKAARSLSKLPETLARAERNQQALEHILTPDGLRLHPSMLKKNSKAGKYIWLALALAAAGLLGHFL